MEGLDSISWKEQNFLWQFWPELIPWYWSMIPMTILWRLEINSSYQFGIILKYEKISCIFTKYAIKIKWKLEKMSNLHSIDMDMKHQNQGIKLDQNHHIKFCSFQLMEGNPSISWHYFHRLEAFHLLSFGYNWYTGVGKIWWKSHCLWKLFKNWEVDEYLFFRPTGFIKFHIFSILLKHHIWVFFCNINRVK